MSDGETRKRPYPSEPPPWQRSPKDHRRHLAQVGPRRSADGDSTNGQGSGKSAQSFAREQTRLNQIQEAEQMREWVSKEDEFVLEQSKKKAHIRVREGRAKTIDWLVVTLGVIDDSRDSLEDDTDEDDVEVTDPSGAFEGLSSADLQAVAKDIDAYLLLEKSSKNRKYWSALKVICEDYRKKLTVNANKHQGRTSSSVLADVDRLLSPKNLIELESLERQIKKKLQSDEPIDVEYWEQLLDSVGVYKSRAELNSLYKTIIQNRLDKLREEESQEAADMGAKLSLLLGEDAAEGQTISPPAYSKKLDPDPMLRLRHEDKALDVIEEKDFLSKAASERRRVQKLGYVPLKQSQAQRSKHSVAPKNADSNTAELSRFAPVSGEDFSSATTALYEREVARGVQDNEEIFAGEEEVTTKSKPQWANKYRPRKPRYFNRVQMGYEWNKYNQTHYDHDNPPPKVVQGYKFNVFYPDLIDKMRAPTYRIERENGRKRGQTSAVAGEEDTCLIKFISGPPYEDIAFRILDKKWDLSAQRERGFRSSFDKGILQLHFQFKKVFYRK